MRRGLSLTTNAVVSLKIEYLSVRPEQRRRAPREFSHSLLNPGILAISFMACQQLDRLSGLLALNPPVVKSLHKTGPCRTQKGDDVEHNNRLRDVSPPLFIVRLGIS